MIEAIQSLEGNLEEVQSLEGNIGVGTKTIYPELIDLEVTPSSEEQIFNHEGSYGYDNVTVKKIEDENLISENIKNGVDILGVIGNLKEKILGTKNITSNGTYKASDDNLDGYSEVTVGIKSLFTGHYDAEGLKQIGWSDEEIEHYQQNGVQWNESEDEYFKLTDTELVGDESKLTRFLPKNSTKTSFSGYYKLLAIPELDTSEVTNMNGMFNACFSLTTIPKLDTSKVTNMNNMFSNCVSLTTIPKLDTSKVTNMSYMFNTCNSLKTIPELDTSEATNMNNMFNTCNSLKTIPELNTSKVTNMNNMFNTCGSLKAIPNLDTSKATDMGYMFNYCYSLTKTPKLNTSNAKVITGMFNNCRSLKTIPELDTSKATSMSYMFNYCVSLTTIPKLNASKVLVVNNMFTYCSVLTDFGGLENLGQSYSTTASANNSNYKLDLSTCRALTEQSLINVLTNLYDIATKGCNTQQVILGSTNLAKLTSEEGQSALAQATAYGWTVS